MASSEGSEGHVTLHDGRYVLLARLGAGAQGETWDAVDKREGRAVAIKRFDVRGARAWKDVELAEREARVLASLSHGKLPRYVEHFEEGGALYLVMEKIDGTPLSTLRQRGPLSEADVVRLLRDADDVLSYLHGRSPAVVHRDLKPSNVLRRSDGSFAFVDFGAVRDRMRPEGGSTVVGTFGYMAPEQFQGRASGASDVYAIGATALALLTGEEPETMPHRGLTIDVDAALRGRSVSRGLRDAIAKMLEPDPDKRPTRIAPLLEHVGRRTTEREKPRADPRREKRENRHERRARRSAERAERRRRAWNLPWLVLLVLTLGLTAAQLAVLVAMRVAVPIVLVMLSLVFGRALRTAAANVSRAGSRAVRAIGRARGAMHGREQEPSKEDAIHVRVVRDEPRVRVEPHADDDENASDEDAAEPPRRKSSGV